MGENRVNFHHDFVVCIEATSNVKPCASQLHNTLKKYFERFLECVDEKDYPLGKLRIKFILFRDFACCAEPIFETDFFNIDASEDFSLVDEFIEKIEFKDGYGYCNALEAIALALQSKWTTLEGYRRYTILVFSNGQVRPLGGNQRLISTYPPNMPKSLCELGAWWEGTEQSLDSTFQSKSSRIICFVSPQDQTWQDMCSWYQYWPAYSQKCGTDLEDVEIQSAIDLIVGDF